MNNSLKVAFQPQSGMIMAQVPSNNATAFGVGLLLGICLTCVIASRMK